MNINPYLKFTKSICLWNSVCTLKGCKYYVSSTLQSKHHYYIYESLPNKYILPSSKIETCSWTSSVQLHYCFVTTLYVHTWELLNANTKIIRIQLKISVLVLTKYILFFFYLKLIFYNWYLLPIFRTKLSPYSRIPHCYWQAQLQVTCSHPCDPHPAPWQRSQRCTKSFVGILN